MPSAIVSHNASAKPGARVRLLAEYLRSDQTATTAHRAKTMAGGNRAIGVCGLFMRLLGDGSSIGGA
jgi:hypothetical protein